MKNKKIALTIIALLTTLSVVAEHNYIPLLDKGKQWADKSYKLEYMIYTITDTVEINGKQYCYMNQSEYAKWKDEPFTYITGKYRYIREEGKKVYHYVPSREIEILLYDFGMEVGDSVIVYDDDFQRNVMLIDSIETITLFEKERLKYYVTCRSYYPDDADFILNDMDIWIEGIGSIKQPVFTNCGFRFGYTGGIYFAYYYEPETGNFYPPNETPIDISAVAMVNADADNIVRTGDCLACDGTMVAYSIAGKPMAQGATIDLAALPRGIYIVRATLHDGGVQTVKVVR